MKGLLLGLVLLTAHAWAHEVDLESSHQEAAVVRLTYADGQPFAFEAYELYLPERDVPDQVGRTDRQGRVVFLPGTRPEWRLKAYSADGHGVDRILDLMISPADGACPVGANASPPRSLLLLTGASVLFGLFGLVQLFLGKRQR